MLRVMTQWVIIEFTLTWPQIVRSFEQGTLCDNIKLKPLK